MDTFYETSICLSRICNRVIISLLNSEMSLAEYGLFFTFREGKSIQSDIECFMSDFKMSETEIELDRYISKQRNVYVKPEYFKNLNREFILRIDYNILNPFYKTYNGFFVYAIDGSDEKLPDYPQVREAFKYFTVHLIIENLAWANFHQYKTY